MNILFVYLNTWYCLFFPFAVQHQNLRACGLNLQACLRTSYLLSSKYSDLFISAASGTLIVSTLSHSKSLKWTANTHFMLTVFALPKTCGKGNSFLSPRFPFLHMYTTDRHGFDQRIDFCRGLKRKQAVSQLSFSLCKSAGIDR